MSPRTSPLAGRHYLTVDEVASQFHVTTRTVRRWIANGDLPAYRIARHKIIRVRRSDADALAQPIVGA